jgi:O-antigen/teichoic acid export membrane protein
MVGIGKPIINTKVVALMGGFNLMGNLLMVPIYGIEGAAVTTIITYLIGFFLMLYFARKFIRFTLPSSSLLKALTGGLITLLFIFDLKSIIKSIILLSPWLELFVVMIPSLLFYLVWILATRALTKDDLRLVGEVIPLTKRFAGIARRFTKS